MIGFRIRTWKTLAVIILLLRILTPLLIFFDPFWVALLLGFLDEIDYSFFLNSQIFTYRKYQQIDKVLDLYYLTALFLASLQWQVTLLAVLYIYRLIGFIAVYLFKNRKLFLVFPNVFEYLYWPFAYAFTKYYGFLKTLMENIWLFLIPVFLIKLYVEYQIHIKNQENFLFRKGFLKRTSWAVHERDKAQNEISSKG